MIANVVLTTQAVGGIGNVEFTDASFEVLDSGVLRLDGQQHTEYFAPGGWLWARQFE